MSEVSLDDPRLKAFAEEMDGLRWAASAMVDQRIADYVAECRVADLARQKRPVSSWINPTVISAWRGRQAAK